MNKSLNTYRILWRWHFYAGLFCIPFIIILAITGSVYLFTPQIEQLREADYVSTSTAEQRSLPAAQMEVAMKAIPDATFQSYRLPQNNQDAVRISVLKNNQRYLVYIDPYTLSVMDIVAWDDRFLELIKDIHGSLLMGKNGSFMVELVASWAIFLVLSGMYLWWPKDAKGLGGVLYPRFKQGGRRFWRDIHAVIGIWSSVFILFLLISGLPWTQVWGSSFKEVRKTVSHISSTDWSLNKKEELQSWRLQSKGYVPLSNKVYERALALKLPAPAELSVSDAALKHWKLTSQTQNRPLRENVWLDNQTGSIIKRNDFDDKPLVDRVIGIGIAAHEGQLFGLFNQILGLLVAISLVILSVSGFILWRKRKPAERLGAPSKLQDQTLTKSKGVIVLLVVLAALLPMLLLSVLCILFLERFVLPLFPRAQKFLGLE